jgi:hypothetical protein
VQSPAEAGRHRLRDLHLAPGSTSLALSPTPDSNRYDLVGSEACWPLNISRAGPRELRPRGRRGAPRPLLVHQLGDDVLLVPRTRSRGGSGGVATPRPRRQGLGPRGCLLGHGTSLPEESNPDLTITKRQLYH